MALAGSPLGEGFATPVSVAGSLWHSNQNLTKRFSCLDASELVTIPSLKIPPKAEKAGVSAQKHKGPTCYLKQLVFREPF